MSVDLLEVATELSARHRPYTLATVVWARGPSSGKQGAKAIIEQDGSVTGWIGGACAEPSVIREARQTMKDGTARLMYLGPADELDGRGREGVVSVPIACASEGALEVFLEPVLPLPHVAVVGRSPAVGMLTELLAVMDWRVTVVDEDGVVGEPHRERVTVVASLAEAAIDPATFVVVATQGHHDEASLEDALATDAGYIGLVASRSRAASVLGYLGDRGVTTDQLERIDAPAGLDLGPIQHREIAVAIVADLVRRRAAGEIGGGEVDTVESVVTAIDPVCGMTVDVADARYHLDHADISYYFCAAGCLQAFEGEPERFLAV